MFPKRWHHGHSIVAGIAGGLLLDRHPGLVFALGVLAGLTLAGVYRLTVELRSAWRSWHRSSSRKRSKPIVERIPF